MIFTRQLATLIDAGPPAQSLNVLAKQEANPTLRVTIEALGDSVQGGSTFSEALAQHPRIFDRLFVNMVKAGNSAVCWKSCSTVWRNTRKRPRS